MADPLLDPLEGNVPTKDLWGLNPNASPLPANGQGPPPAPAPDLNISERQRWGTSQTPIDPQTNRPVVRRGDVTAFDTGPPPLQQGQPLDQKVVDENAEWGRVKEDEVNAYVNNKLSIIDYTPLPDKFSKEQHQEWGKLQNAQQMLAQIRDPKEAQKLAPMVRQLETRITNDVKAKNAQESAARRVQMARDDAPYQSVEARINTSNAVGGQLTSELDKTVAMSQSRNTAQQRQGDFDLSTSAFVTMSTPLPGKDAEKPNAQNRDYTTLRDAATDLVIHNRKLPDAAAGVRYINKMATFAGGTDEKGNPVQGYNGRTGAAAAHYRVIGRDEAGNVLVQMNDGVKLRVPPDTYRKVLTARQQSAARARQWEIDYKASQEPGMIRRAINWGASKIPATGF